MNSIPFPSRSYDDLPIAESIEFGELLAINLTSSTNPFTHGLHRYPAKFIPQVPRWAIRQYSRPGDIVLDPFSGSGTTVVEAVAEGRRGFGIDLDPLACLIGAAKVADYDTARLREIARGVLQRSQLSAGPPLVPMAGVANFGHWFSEDAWSKLQAIKAAIETVEMSGVERDFFLVVFSSIIRAVSNADDQTQKTYVSGTLKKTPPPVQATFEKRLWRAIDSAEELTRARGSGSGVIVHASATALPTADESVDLMVSSPPYLDSVDYMYNLMLEYFWLGSRVGLASRAEFNLARRAGIGSKQPSNVENAMPERLSGLIDLDGFPAYRRSVVAPYFSGLAQHFGEASRVLKPGGRYVLVIGNSRTKSGMLPLHDALVALAADAGLHMEHAFGYRIRRHHMRFPRKGRGGIILMDWVITLTKRDSTDAPLRQLPLIDDQLHPDAVAN
ncbi:putative methyltransferase [compost metagenome]